MSDEAYTSFLDKANEDPSPSFAKEVHAMTADRFVSTKTVDTNQEVPTSLNNLEEYYASDTDEPFEPVVLNWNGAKKERWPSVGT